MTVLEREDQQQEELDSLRATVRDVCERFAGTASVRRLDAAGSGIDEQAWQVLAEQVGLSCLGLPEESGGAGGLRELAVVCEELGRALLPVPFLSSTVLAGQVLARVGAAGSAALERVAAGEVATLAALGPRGVWDPWLVPVQATATGDGWTLTGTVRSVLDGAAASLVVVAARTPEGPDLFLVEAGAAGLAVRRVETLDLARAQAAVQLDTTPAVRLTTGGTAGLAVAPALDVAAVALAAEQFGGAQACLDMTVAYVRERRQFGRAIGSFQAVKHACADLLVLVESCRAAVARAVEAGLDDPLVEASSVAQAWCSDAFRTVSAETVQLHGGIGFTWEHDAHLYFRRARADAVLFGDAAHHRERLADTLGW